MTVSIRDELVSWEVVEAPELKGIEGGATALRGPFTLPTIPTTPPYGPTGPTPDPLFLLGK
jgi:hypothetical protein